MAARPDRRLRFCPGHDLPDVLLYSGLLGTPHLFHLLRPCPGHPHGKGGPGHPIAPILLAACSGVGVGGKPFPGAHPEGYPVPAQPAYLVPPPGLLLGDGAAQPPRARLAGALRRDSGLLSSGVPRGGPVCGGPAGGRGGAVPDGAAHPVEPVCPCGAGGVPGTDRGAGGGGVPCSEPPGRRNSGAAGPAPARTGGVGAGRSAGLRGALPGHGALPA